MQQIVINSETPENKALEKAGDKSAVAAVNSNFNGCVFFPFLSSLSAFKVITD